MGVGIGRRPDRVKQFSVFMPNRLGRLHQLLGLLHTRGVHVLALMVLDSTDTAIIRMAVSDPEGARSVLEENSFPFTEADLLVVELAATTQLGELMTALLEAEVNVNYIYSFIPHPEGKSLLAFSVEDEEVAERVLAQHQFRILKQSDISR